MVYLRKVSVHNNDYYYLFATTNNPFRKHKKYIGMIKPDVESLGVLKKRFKEEIQQKITEPEKHEFLNVVALLQDIQNKHSYISEEDIVKLSKELGIPSINLYGVLTFYSQFKTVRPGKNHVCVCRGTACHVKRSDELLKHLEEKFGIKNNETTKDNNYSLEAVNCIGACAKAPAIMINKKVYGELDKKKIDKILSELK